MIMSLGLSAFKASKKSYGDIYKQITTEWRAKN
jgi:hypothetical protein